jgi:hypothetical protein
MVMVVKEPGFVAAVAQGGLNFSEIHASSIVNDGGETKAATDLYGLSQFVFALFYPCSFV